MRNHNGQQKAFTRHRTSCAYQHARRSAGFTLVEMLVSVAIFTVVITMSVGTLLILVDANGRAQSMQLVMTNLTFALDSMTREIRTGFNWYCGTSVGEPAIADFDGLQDCAPGNYLSVVESSANLTEGLNSRRITYWFDATNKRIMRKLGDDTDSTDWISLTSGEVEVDEVRFDVTDTDRLKPPGNDMVQPTATIYIKGRAGVSTIDVEHTKEREFDIETTISQRLLDI